MSWRATIVLGILAAAVGIPLAVLNGGRQQDDQGRVDFLAGWGYGQVERIEIAAPGRVEIILERSASAGVARWNLAKPRVWTANEYMVEDMLRTLFGARHSAVLKPGDKEHTPERYGLTPARFTVAIQGEGRRTVVRFGNESKVHAGQVWIQVDTDPNIYFVGAEVVEAFQRDVYQLRSKRLASFDPSKATRIVLSEWVERVIQKKNSEGKIVAEKKSEYEVSEMAYRLTEPRGWFLAKPEERLDDMQVNALLTGIRSVVAEDLIPLPGLRECGLEDAGVKVAVEVPGSPPSVFRFGSDVKGKAGKLYVWVEGSDEVAIVDKAHYVERLPRSRNALRSRQIVFWTEAQTTRIEIESGGRIALVPEKRKVTTENVETEVVVWRPADTEAGTYDEDACTNFVRMLYQLTLRDDKAWMGRQDQFDLKQLKLDPPEATLRFVLDGAERTLLFGIASGVDDVVMKKAWHDELYWVPAPYVRWVRRMELNYRKPKVWDAGSPDKIRGFWFDDRSVGPGVSWQVAREGPGKAWQFTDQKSLDLKREADPARAADLLSKTNYVQAIEFIGKDEETRKKFGLEIDPPGKLWLILGPRDTDRKVLYLSENLGKRHDPIYYARFDDDPVVFRIESELVDLLLSGLHQRPKPEGGGDRKPEHP